MGYNFLTSFTFTKYTSNKTRDLHLLATHKHMAAPTQAEEHRYAIPVLYHPYNPTGPSSLPYQNGQQLCVADILNVVFGVNEKAFTTRTTPAMRQDMYNFICKNRAMRHFFRDAFWWLFLQHLADHDLEVALDQAQQNALLSDADTALLSLEAVEERVRRMAPKGPKHSPAGSPLPASKSTTNHKPLPTPDTDATAAAVQRRNTRSHLFSSFLPAHLEVGGGVGNRQLSDVVRVGCPRSYGTVGALSATLEDECGSTTTTKIAPKAKSHNNDLYDTMGTRGISTGRLHKLGANSPKEDVMETSLIQMSSESIGKKSKQRNVILVGGLRDSDSDGVEEEGTSLGGTALPPTKTKTMRPKQRIVDDVSLVDFIKSSSEEVKQGEAAQSASVVESYVDAMQKRESRRCKATLRKSHAGNPVGSSTTSAPQPLLVEVERSLSPGSVSSRASSVDSVCTRARYEPTPEIRAVGDLLAQGNHSPSSIDKSHGISESATPEEDADNVLRRDRGEIRKLLIKRGYVNLARIPLSARHPIVCKEQHKLFTRMSLNYTKSLQSSILSHMASGEEDAHNSRPHRQDDAADGDHIIPVRSGVEADLPFGEVQNKLPPIHGTRKQSVVSGAHLGFTVKQHEVVQRRRPRRPQHYVVRDMISRFIPDVLSQGLYLAFVLALPFAVNTHLGGKFQESILHHVSFWIGGVEMNMRPVVGSVASLMVPPPGFTAPAVDNSPISPSSSQVLSSTLHSGSSFLVSPPSAQRSLDGEESRANESVPEVAASQMMFSSVPGVSTFAGRLPTKDPSQAALASEALAVSVSVASWPVQSVVMLVRRRRRDQLTRLKQGLFSFDDDVLGAGSRTTKNSPSSTATSPSKDWSYLTGKAIKKSSIYDVFKRRHRHDPYYPQEVTIETLNILISTSKRDAQRQRNAAQAHINRATSRAESAGNRNIGQHKLIPTLTPTRPPQTQSRAPKPPSSAASVTPSRAHRPTERQHAASARSGSVFTDDVRGKNCSDALLSPSPSRRVHFNNGDTSRRQTLISEGSLGDLQEAPHKERSPKRPKALSPSAILRPLGDTENVVVRKSKASEKNGNVQPVDLEKEHQARTARLIDRQVLAFQREMGRLTNTHTFAAFHNFLSESEDVKYNSQHAGKNSSSGSGLKPVLIDQNDDRHVDSFLLGGSKEGATQSSTANSSTSANAGSNKPQPGRHGTSRNAQTIKADLDEKFLQSAPWWMKHNARVRRPAQGRLQTKSGEDGGGEGGGVAGFESTVGMTYPGTKLPQSTPHQQLDNHQPIPAGGLKFGLTNWSPLVHRYMLLLGSENNVLNSSISWTV